MLKGISADGQNLAEMLKGISSGGMAKRSAAMPAPGGPSRTLPPWSRRLTIGRLV